ncbi:MAG: TraB/GumN family protein, partial [Bdellovibrionales bacterium]|nr:TraB/GumN family protein [Bdellovibrionales bacterium]
MNIETIKDNVDLIQYDDRSIYIVGTAHVSEVSADLAEEVIREQCPDSVAVELCDARYTSLKNPDRWKDMDIVSVIRGGKSYVLLAQLMLAGFQKKLGDQLKIKPGAEMMRAIEVAEDIGSKTVLADRDIRTTLKRTWSSLGFFGMMKLLFSMIFGLFSTQEIDEKEIERLKESDALEELMKEFSDALPGVRTALIDERDQYLAGKIKAAPGNTVVAIVGAGHVPGIKSCFAKDIDLEKLEKLPKPKKLTKALAWFIPCLVLGMFIYGFSNSGAEKSYEMAATWFWWNGGLGALGSLLALGHPLTILAAFVASPFTSLNPFIAGGWVAGLVEALIRKPR